MAQAIFIEEYSSKSFVVRGETRIYKDSLKNLGGKWNSSLTDKKSGEKFGAWLFWSDKRSDIDNWFSKGCPTIKNASTRDNHKYFSYTTSSSVNSDNQIELTIKRIENKVDRLTNMLEALCSKLNVIDVPNDIKEKNLMSNSIIEDELEVENDDDIPIKPLKRLLAKVKRV